MLLSFINTQKVNKIIYYENINFIEPGDNKCNCIVLLTQSVYSIKYRATKFTLTLKHVRIQRELSPRCSQGAKGLSVDVLSS